MVEVILHDFPNFSYQSLGIFSKEYAERIEDRLTFFFRKNGKSIDLEIQLIEVNEDESI